MLRKCILIVLDGLGDRSYESLGHQTPLQAAHTPAMDALASRGACGLYHASVLGQALPSENAHFALFGYDSSEFPGRGPLEALGGDVSIRPEDVAVLAHFASLREERGILILDSGAPRITSLERDVLCAALGRRNDEQVELQFIPTKSFFGILRLKGPVSPYITDTDPIRDGRPLHEALPWGDYAGDPNTQRTARVVKRYLLRAFRLLNRHPMNIQRSRKGAVPVNGLVTQRAGRLKQVLPFSAKLGMKGLSVASGIVYCGLARYLGLDFLQAPSADGPYRELLGGLHAAAERLHQYDFFHVHTKAPDEAAHTKDPIAKTRVIEELDRALDEGLPPLLRDPSVLVVLTSDHSTPSAGPLIHSGEPVPLVFHGSGVRRDRVRAFNEVDTAGGALGQVRGKELMYLVLNHLDRARLQGLMDEPEYRDFWPGAYDPFRLQG